MPGSVSVIQFCMDKYQAKDGGAAFEAAHASLTGAVVPERIPSPVFDAARAAVAAVQGGFTLWTDLCPVSLPVVSVGSRVWACWVAELDAIAFVDSETDSKSLATLDYMTGDASTACIEARCALLSARLGFGEPSKSRITIAFLRHWQMVRRAGVGVSLRTDPAWLLDMAIGRRAGWLEDPHSFGICAPVNGKLPRMANGDTERHLLQIARRVNGPCRVYRSELGSLRRYFARRLPDRFSDYGDDA